MRSMCAERNGIEVVLLFYNTNPIIIHLILSKNCWYEDLLEAWRHKNKKVSIDRIIYAFKNISDEY